MHGKLPSRLLHPLKHLQLLTLTRSGIRSIPSNTFHGLRHLQVSTSLYLSYKTSRELVKHPFSLIWLTYTLSQMKFQSTSYVTYTQWLLQWTSPSATWHYIEKKNLIHELLVERFQDRIIKGEIYYFHLRQEGYVFASVRSSVRVYFPEKLFTLWLRLHG